METVIRDYTIAKFLIDQAKKQNKFIEIITDQKYVTFTADTAPEDLTNRFLELAANTKNIKIGLKGD